MITRYSVAWMENVPEDIGAGECRYDIAEWGSKSLQDIERARELARYIAKTNKWRQSWLYVDHAPRANSPEWQWDRDHDATEIFEG